MPRHIILIAGIILIVTSGLMITVAFIRGSTVPPWTAQPITLSGHLDCLPHKDSAPGQPHTMECAIGLKANDESYYHLKNLSQSQSATPFTATVTVTGDITAPPADERYDVRGVMAVKNFTVQ